MKKTVGGRTFDTEDAILVWKCSEQEALQKLRVDQLSVADRLQVGWSVRLCLTSDDLWFEAAENTISCSGEASYVYACDVDQVLENWRENPMVRKAVSEWNSRSYKNPLDVQKVHTCEETDDPFAMMERITAENFELKDKCLRLDSDIKFLSDHIKRSW